MTDIKVTEEGEILVKCPTCHGYRTYSHLKDARHKAKIKRECVACAKFRRKQFALEQGFSGTEFSNMANAAIKRGRSWGLSLEDIIAIWDRQEGRCAFTGAPMQKYPRSWSIDRIDNSCGYTPGNVQLVLKEINLMRGKLTVEKFVTYCHQISTFRSST